MTSASNGAAIAVRAGVNVGTLYRYFPSKDALLGALVEREAGATLDAIDAALERTARQPIDDVIAALFEATLAPSRLDARVHRELVEQLSRSGRVDVLRDLEQKIGTRLERVIAERTGSDAAAVTAFVVLHAAEALVHAIRFLRPANVERGAATDAATAMIAGFLRRTNGTHSTGSLKTATAHCAGACETENSNRVDGVEVEPSRTCKPQKKN